MPAPEPERELSPEEKARLDQMEADLRALAERTGGISEEQMQALLEAQADALRAEFERQLRAQTPPPSPASNSDALLEQEARQRMEEERARLAAINARQIASNGLVIDEGNPVKGGSGAGNRRQSDNEAFLASAASQSHETVRAGQIGNPSRTIVQGTILEAALESAIDTDLPGAIRAVLTVDVLSYDGTSVLLPRGTRLIGTYSSKVKIAQSRALIAWNRAITPDGTSVELGGIGGDELGRSGQTGDVDTHFWEALRLGGADLADRGGLAGGDRRRHQ